MKSIKILKILLATFLIAGLGACVDVDELSEETQTIQLDKAKSVEVQLKMRAGELRLQGGARELMEGHFSYNIDHWKPEIDYHLVGQKGILSVEQGRSGGIPMGNTRNRWDILLSKDVPIDLEINFGAGQGKLDLSQLMINSLDIDMGVGDLTIDLTGEHKQNLDVAIDGGVGHATIYLPENIGVQVKVDGGIGSVNAGRMNRSGHTYTNDTFGKTNVSIDISIDGGIGSIDLKLK
jgi:hypothetical protein